MDREELRIRGFLKFGYFLGPFEHRYPIDFGRIDRERYRGLSEAELIRVGIRKLDETIEALVDRSRDNVVPISGGLDSRLILGALVRHLGARKVHTYTYGVPGSYDYELGGLVAKSAGTRHVAFPLDQITYYEDELLDVAQQTRCQGAFLYHPPLRQIGLLFRGCVIWSGYVGDAVAGGHLKATPARAVEEAKRRYARNRALVRSIQLHGCSDEEFLPWIEGAFLAPSIMSYDEQVLFAEAVPKFTEPLVLVPPFEYGTPLINTPWMDFMFSVPDAMRFGERLMIRIGETAFPELFSLPAKNRFGLTLSAPPRRVFLQRQYNRLRKLVHQFLPFVRHPYVLYNDFDEAVRCSPDVRRLVLDCLERLKRRGVVSWLDLDGLWARHQRRLRNHGDAFVLLACLELNLRSQELSSSGALGAEPVAPGTVHPSRV